MELLFVTNNEIKYKVAQKSLSNSGIKLLKANLNIPEIQSLDVEEIAKFSADYAYRELKQPLAISDSGFFIEGLRGFPGPLIKFVNKQLFAEDYLRLMNGINNRKVLIKECLIFQTEQEENIMFTHEYKGNIAFSPGLKARNSLEQILILDGLSKPISELKESQLVNYWSINSVWKKLSEYLLSTG